MATMQIRMDDALKEEADALLPRLMSGEIDVSAVRL